MWMKIVFRATRLRFFLLSISLIIHFSTVSNRHYPSRACLVDVPFNTIKSRRIAIC